VSIGKVRCVYLMIVARPFASSLLIAGLGSLKRSVNYLIFCDITISGLACSLRAKFFLWQKVCQFGGTSTAKSH
jgi:hypothetical protein